MAKAALLPQYEEHRMRGVCEVRANERNSSVSLRTDRSLAPRGPENFMLTLTPKKITITALALLAAGLLVLADPKMISGAASAYGWAHAYCYLNNARLIWLHVITDSVIFLSYSAISIVLAYLVYRTHRGMPFSWMFLAFGTFIIACGFTHLMEVIVLWKPLYWLSGDVKLLTAVASLATAVALPPLVPKVQAMVESAKMSEKRAQTLRTEIERRVRTEEMLRKLSGRVLTLQDEERRRLGRELHDGAGQVLAALHLNLGMLSQWTRNDPRISEKVSDSAALTDQVISEVRTLSYLLHPPMLDEAGLASAVEWYVRGFSERSKIAVTLDVDPEIRRFPRDVETAIFRIIQECMVNIHRHSGSGKALVCLRTTDGGVSLTIRDEGNGISAEMLRKFEEGTGDLGVGIGGMCERARQLGGSITIRRVDPGTLVEVHLPVPKQAQQEEAAAGTAAG
jgi:signal transduction histidine kinase